MSEKPIRMVVVAGSVRPGNFTSKALSLVADELAKSEDGECPCCGDVQQLIEDRLADIDRRLKDLRHLQRVLKRER